MAATKRLQTLLNDTKMTPLGKEKMQSIENKGILRKKNGGEPGIRTPFCYPQAHANNRKSITCNILSAQKRQFTPPKRHHFDTAGTLLQNGSALIHDKIHDAKVTIRRFGLATYLLETTGILADSLLLSDLDNTAISLSKGDLS